MPVLNDFDFQTVLARRRGANFADFNSKSAPTMPVKSAPTMPVLNESGSRAGVVQILPHLQQPILRARPFLGADFPSQRSHKTMENTAFRALPTRQILMSHISAVSHLRDHISWLTDLQRQLSV